MSHRYDELFDAFYLGDAPSWLAPGQIARFRIDALRRRLDLSSRLRSGFPMTSYYAHAHVGDAMLEGVAVRFPQATRREGSVTAAVVTAAADWAIGQSEAIRALLTYEGLQSELLRQRHPPADPALVASAGLRPGAVVAEFSIDVVPLVHYLERLWQHGAPDAMVRAAPVTPRRVVLAAYVHEDSAFVKDVSERVGEVRGE